ncbi:MAG TPA: alpha/beta fold hydrolase [Vicinamibacterales bacterium]|nr:alpha/beta fold hydrolase [Vicinamibacterales bacterium]
MKSQIAHLPHRSLRYLESGEGRALVLLHAFPLSADQWLPQLHRVPQGWRFIAPDLRGFRGAGAAFEDPGLRDLSIDDYADDVAALLTHLEIERAVIGGVSMGGYVAFGLLRRAPHRVSGLLLSNTRATPDTAEGRAGREKMIALAREEGAAATAAQMVPKLLGETTKAQQPDLVDAVRRLIIMNSPDGIVAGLGALRDRPDSTPLLASVNCPTLIIAGDEDSIINVSEAETMHAAIPGSHLVVLPRTGHLGNLEQPNAWRTALDQWLTGIWAFR